MGGVLSRPHRALALLALPLLAPGCASRPSEQPAALSGSGTLVVRAGGLASASGQVAFALFGSAAAFEDPGEPLAVSRLPVDREGSEWVVTELPFGDYAVKVFHDLDGDGELDRGPLGAPAEPYGFSNDARGKLGPPSFAAARFRHQSERTVLEVALR